MTLLHECVRKAKGGDATASAGFDGVLKVVGQARDPSLSCQPPPPPKDGPGLLAAIKSVEREGGRTQTRRWGPRVIDVDILFFGDEQVSEADLTVPHPGIGGRPFVLESLRELGVAPS